MRERNIAAEVDAARDREWAEYCAQSDLAEEYTQREDDEIEELLTGRDGTLEEILDRAMDGGLQDLFTIYKVKSLWEFLRNTKFVQNRVEASFDKGASL